MQVEFEGYVMLTDLMPITHFSVACILENKASIILAVLVMGNRAQFSQKKNKQTPSLCIRLLILSLECCFFVVSGYDNVNSMASVC